MQSRLTLLGQPEVLLRSLVARARVVTIIAAAALAVAAAPAEAASLVDDTVADFAAAPSSASTWVTEPGSVRLRPMVLSEGFDDLGPTLPATLTSEQWFPPAGTAIVGSGSLTIDGKRVHPPDTTQIAPDVLEFRATFDNTPFQHVGFGTTFNEAPWAMFSTGGGALSTGLYARTRDASGIATDDALAIDPLVPHTYRIEWQEHEVRYLVDGALVATHTITIAGTLRPVASDFTEGSGMLKIDWLGVGSNPASGVFESRVHDASDERAVWENLTATSTGGTVEIETRAGNSSSPDMTWSSWQPLGAGGAIASPIRRYIQYRATLSGGSPSLDRVEIGYEVDDVAPAAAIDDVDVNGAVATVRFSSPAVDVDRFECRLGDAPGAVFSTCSSPQEFAGLAHGSHTVFVRAVDEAGNAGPAAQQSFVVDLEPPVAVIDDVDVNGAVATVRFSSPAVDVDRFECRLGDAPGAVFSTCSSPQEFAGLAHGSHTVFVRAVDEAGNAGPAAQQSFVVDLEPPVAVIDDVDVNGAVATVRFSSPAVDVDRFECRLGDAPGAVFSTCSSPQEFAGLAHGSHTVFVRAVDEAGNAGLAAQQSFVVDLEPPVAVIDDVDVNGAVATVRFSSPAVDVDRFECRLGDAPGAVFSTCSSPQEFAGLAHGSHTVFVRAVDEAGNTGSVVQRGFTIPAPASGGGQGGGTTQPPPGPDIELDETAPAIDVLTRSARASGSGLVVLHVSCPDDEVRCRLSVRLKHGRSSSQRKTASVLGGKQVRVRVRLPKATRLVLLERARLKVTALVTARDNAGNVETTKHKLTLRPPSV